MENEAIPPHPPPGSGFREEKGLFAACAALCGLVSGAAYWNVRRDFKVNEMIAGDLLLRPSDWGAMAAFGAVGAVIAGLLATIPRRVLGPAALLPMAGAGLIASLWMCTDDDRDHFSLLVWRAGLGVSAGLAAWDMGLPARLRRLASTKWRLRLRSWFAWGGVALLAAAGAAGALYYYNFGCLLLADLHTHTFDFGNLHQSMWTLAETGHSATTLMGYSGLEAFGFSWWGEHFTPIQFFLLPFYEPFRSPESLLVLQNAALALALIPLWLAVRAETGSRAAATLLGFGFLLHPLVVRGAYNDFHYEAFFPLFFFGAFYFFVKGRAAGMATLLFASFMVKESTASYVLCWAVATAIFDRDRRRLGVVAAILALGYFALAMGHAIPSVRHGELLRVLETRYHWMFAARDIPPFEGARDLVFAALRYPQDVIAALLHEDRWRSPIRLMAPWAFLCLLRPWTLLMFLPAAAVNILADYLAQAQFDLYHTLEIAPLMLAATSAALAKPSAKAVRVRRRRLRSCAFIALAIALHGAHEADSQLPGGKRFATLPPVLKRVREWSERIYLELRAVPSERRVASGYFLCAPLSDRQWAFHFGEDNIPFFDLADREGRPVVDTIIVARVEMIHTSPIVGSSPGWIRRHIGEKMKNGWWELDRPYDPELGLLFLRRRAEQGPPIANADDLMGDLMSAREP